MSREIPFSRSFYQVIRSRYAASVYGHLRSLLDTVVPVQQVGSPDFSDIERPSWGIATYTPLHVNRYSTCSIASDVDIAIEGVGASGDELRLPSPPYPPGGRRPWPGPFVLLTPPSYWVPWFNTPAPGAVAWTPGIRPQADFDLGRTLAITGNVTAPPPYWGLEIFSSVTPWYDSAIAFPYASQGPTWHSFSPALILPAGFFLTLCTAKNDTELYVSWRYREIG